MTVASVLAQQRRGLPQPGQRIRRGDQRGIGGREYPSGAVQPGCRTGQQVGSGGDYVAHVSHTFVSG
jgi:hypothetical protein